MVILDEKGAITEKSAIAVGMFDGFHRGHRELIEALRRDGGLKTLIYTFLRKDTQTLLFNCSEKKLLLEKQGVDFALLQEFTQKFMQTTREEFMDALRLRLKAGFIAAGEDFRFGKNAEGDIDYLKGYCKKNGIGVEIVPACLYEGKRISSTRIRECVKNGDMSAAAAMLGFLYFAAARVESGRHIGRSIDFPTVNIKTDKILPSFGVYATLTAVDGKLYASVSNVGVKPTVSDGGKPNIETNIFDFNREIYGKEISVHFVQKIRGEFRFSGIDELKSQIARDKETAAKILREKDIYKKTIL